MTVQTVNFMAIATSGTKVSSASKNDFSFDSFLEGGKEVSNADKTENSMVPTASNQSQKTDDKQSVTESKEYSDVHDDSNMQSESVESTEAVQSDRYEETALPAEAEELPEDVLAKILSLLNEIVSVLQDTLQIGEKPLLDAAEAIQFEMTDFFDNDRMKELFLQVQGFETADLLTNEDLYQTLEQLQNDLTEIFGHSGFEELLINEGFSFEQFDISMFKEQISEYVGAVFQPEVVNEVAEVVIEFEQEINTKFTTAEHVFVDTTENTEVLDGTTMENENGFTSEEQGSFEADKRFDQATMFLQKLVSLSRSGEAENIQPLNDGFDLYDIARQIIDQVKIQIRPDNTKMELQLNPEHLGKVELEITSKNGELSARLNVQNDYVKEAVESQMQVLRETLEVQGLKVENIEVTVAEFGFRFQDESAGAEQQQQQQRRNGRVAFEDAESDDNGFSDVSEVMKEMNGNSVDYVA